MTFLDFAEGGSTAQSSSAVSISGDGDLTTGFQFEYGTYCRLADNGTCIAPTNTLLQAFRTDDLGSALLSLTTKGTINSASSDGSTIVGEGVQNISTPFRWREDTGYQELYFDPLLSALGGSPAKAVSANGTVVGGEFGLWVNGSTVEVSNLLINGYGLRPHGLWLQSKPPNVTNSGVTGVSDDGLSIVGIAIKDGTAAGAPRERRAYFARVDSAPLATTVATLPPYVPDTFGFLTGPLLSAALPLARSTQVNRTVTAFVTLINRTEQGMEGCSIGFNADLPLTFNYAPTRPSDNSIIGPADALFALNAGQAKSFVISMTPSREFPSSRLDSVYECGNALRGTLFPELNDLVLASSVTPVPDVLALSATTTNDGIAGLDANNQAAFSVATLNLGAASSSIRVDAFATGGLAAFATSICETNSITGECLGAAAVSLTRSYAAAEERTFGVFVTSSQPIEPRYETRRVRVQFTDSTGELRGSTSVAVVTL